MAGADYSLSLSITATNSAMGALSNLISGLGPVGGAVAAVGAALVGVGVVSVKMAAQYQQSMNSVQALTGATNAQMAQYDTQLKALAVDAGVAPDELSKGLYQVISAGYAGSDAMKVLTLATQDSKIGMTDEATVADALTNVMASFSVKVSDATRVNGIMLETVTLGKSTFSQYASTISKAATTSSQFHISLETMSAAWATMTANGIRAKQATTDYVQVVQSMYGKVATIAKSLQKNGIAFNEAAFNAANFQGKVTMLNTAMQEAIKKHVAVTGVTLQAAQALQVLSQHSSTYSSDLATLSDRQAMAQKTAQAWAITQSGFSQQMSRAKAALDVLMISIGQQLLPVLTKFAQQLTPMLLQFSTWLTQSGALKIAASFLAGALQGLVSTIAWLATTLGGIITFFQQNEWAMDALKSVLIAFAIVVAPMVVAALIGMATAAWAAAVPIIAMALPFIALGLVIAAFVFGVIELYKHWGAITDWISGKTEQMHIKMELQDSQAAVKKDQQQKQSAQKTLANLEKEKADILAKLKQTHDAATKAELQHQLEMTQRQIDGQNARIAAADRDAALQKAKQAQLHADLLEAQKSWHERFDDMVNKWVSDQLSKFNAWRQGLDSRFNSWVAGNLNALNNWRGQFDAGFNAWVASSLNTINNWRAQIDNTFNSWVAGAVNWGRDLIQNLINGINSMLGNLTGAVGNVASTIASMLHFTKPDKGPLKTVDEWMPHLGDTLILGLNNIAPGLQAAAIRAAASVAGPIQGTTDGAMPSHIFDFIGSNYAGYASGMVRTQNRQEAAQDKAARHAAVEARRAAALSRREAAVESHIQKLEQHYHITLNHRGRWTRADATELAKLMAEQTRLQGKNPQTASGRRG